jgi:hypothetical protein
MPLSFEDVQDPSKVLKEIETDIIRLADLCDKWLVETFYRGDMNEHMFSPGGRITGRSTAYEFMRRYSIIGWDVRWDGTLTNPYFYFRPTKPQQEQQEMPRDPWWRFWR